MLTPIPPRLDTITYATIELGIVRAEGVAFAVSPRNSAPGVAYLIDKTGSEYLIFTSDLKPLVDAALVILKEQGSKIPVFRLMPTFKDLFPEDDSEDFEYLSEPRLKGLDDPIVLLHSSGTPGYSCLGTVFMRIVARRLCCIPKAHHFYKSHCGLLFAFAMVRWS